jgi:hypothetical protein
MADYRNSDKNKLKQKVEEWDTIFGILSNTTKKMLVFYLGHYGKSKGGSKDLILPIVDMGKKFGADIHPFSVAPKLSELRNKDKMVDLDKNGFWHLTERGTKAYMLIEHVWKNWFSGV